MKAVQTLAVEFCRIFTGKDQHTPEQHAKLEKTIIGIRTEQREEDLAYLRAVREKFRDEKEQMHAQGNRVRFSYCFHAEQVLEDIERQLRNRPTV